MMNYPIDLSFKILALASQIRVMDASGQMLGYVKQKMFKLKEDIGVFQDESQTNQLFAIKADRIIDFSAKYNFTDRNGTLIGSIRRKGMRSLWKAHYEIYDERENLVMEINEENAWIKVIDGLVGEVPIIGIFSGYFFNPAYLISRNGAVVARLQKQRALFEGKFQLTPQGEMNKTEEARLLLSVLTMTLLERTRG